MKYRRRYGLWALCCALGWPWGLWAQPLHMGSYHIYDNVSKGLIKSLCVDKDGYVWVGTDVGLFRYDGERTEFFNDELEGGFVKRVFCRKNGQLVVTYDLGVLLIEPEAPRPRFQRLLPIGEGQRLQGVTYPKTVFEDQQGRVWIGEDEAVIAYAGGRVARYPLPTERRHKDILRNYTLQEDAHGTLWAFSFGGDVYAYVPGEDRFERRLPPLPLDGITMVLAGGAEGLLLGTYAGLFLWQVGEGGQVRGCVPLGGPRNISCGIRVGEEVFFGTWDSGIYRSRPDGTAIQSLEVQPFSKVLDLHFDARSGLWAVSEENVATLNLGFFQDLRLSTNDLPADALALLPDSSLLVANYDALDRIALGPRGPMGTEALAVGVTQGKTALMAEGGVLWMGTIAGELWWHERGSGLSGRVGGIAGQQRVTQVVADGQGQVWAMGNLPRGVARVDVQRRAHVYADPSLPPIQTALRSSGGAMLFGGSHPQHYLYRYDAARDRLVDMSVPLPFAVKMNFAIHQMAEEAPGLYLLGSSHGLLRYRVATATVPASVERLPLPEVAEDEPVLALARQADGALWLSTPSGLLYWAGEVSLLYGPGSGLPGNSLMLRGLLLDSHGRLCVATSRGAALLQVPQDPQATRTAAPTFTHWRSGSAAWEALGAAHKRQCAHGMALELGFFSPTFPPEQVSYQRRLLGKGQTGQWVDMGSTRQLSLPSLPPGAYRLELRARKAGGFFWSSASVLEFKVLPPWYLSWWGMGLLLLGLVGIVAGAARLYNQRLLQQQRRLEALVAARTQELVAQNEKIVAQKNQIIAQQRDFQQLKEKQLQEKIQDRNKELTTHTLHLLQKNRALRDLQAGLYDLMRQNGGKQMKEVKHLLSLIDFSFRNDDEWERFKLYFESVHPGFFEQLVADNPHLTAQELRLCTLTRLNLSIAEIASILGISPESVKTARFRLRKKLNMESASEMADYLMSL